MFRAFKFYASAQESHISEGQHIFMPPLCIRSRRKQTHHTLRPFFPHFMQRFGEPKADRFPVRRIHPAHAVPVLGKSILFRREITGTFGIFRCGADIQSKGPCAASHFLKKSQGVGQSVLWLENMACREFIATVPYPGL
jgi:hypothetical protein